MIHILHIAPDADRLRLREQAHHEQVTLCPGFRWSDRVVLADGASPIVWPGVTHLDVTDFPGLPPEPRRGSSGPQRHPSPALPTGPVLDQARQMVAHHEPWGRYVSRHGTWCLTRSGRRATAHQQVRLNRILRSRYAQIAHRAAALAAWLAYVADNDVAAGVIRQRHPDGTCEVLLTFGGFRRVAWLVAAEQTRGHRPGDRVAVRLLTSLGGRVTERDPAIVPGILQRIAGEDVAPPLWNGWSWLPSTTVVLVPNAAYACWVAAAPTYHHLTGRSLLVLPEGQRPSAWVRRVLCSSCRVIVTEAGLCIAVPRQEFGRWRRERSMYLPLLQDLTQQRVWFAAR